MRTVLVSAQVHALPRSGGTVRTLRLAQALAARSELHLVSIAGVDEPKALQDATGAVQVHVHAGRSGVPARLLAAGRLWPLGTARAWDPAAARVVAGLARNGAVVVLDHLDTTPYAPPARHVLSLHNAEADLGRCGPVRGWRSAEQQLDAVARRRAERRAVRRPGVVPVVTTQRDADLLDVACTVVPNGADLPPSVTAVPQLGTLLFVGALDYAPNVEAVAWWVEEIAPRLPGRVLTVVGRAADQLPTRLSSHSSVEVLGEVPVVAPHLERAALVLAPLRSGGGSRLKVLEALGAGRPVLATPKGIEGLDLEPGRDVVVASGPAAFAAEVECLLVDRARRQALADAGRQAVRRYDWRVIGQTLTTAVLGA